jgi:hypothetical protein
MSQKLQAGREALIESQEVYEEEQAAKLAGDPDAELNSRLALKVVFYNIAKKYDVTQQMVREAMQEVEENDVSAKCIAEAEEYHRQEEIKNSKWLTFYWTKWRPLHFIIRFAIVYGAVCLFPPLVIVVLPYLFLVWVRFQQNNPTHWANGVVDVAGKALIAGAVYNEYKKFRDGPKPK